MRCAISLVILLLFSTVIIYDADASEGRSTNHSVDIQSMAFTPNTITIQIGASGGGLAWTGADNVPVWKTFLIGLAISMVIIYVLPKEGEQEASSGEE